MNEIIIDTLLDALKILPFLFVAFLIIEFFEHKLTNKSEKAIKKAGNFGPIVGSLLGAIPQCGFSVLATNLYVTRIITLGTLISIYLSTSDEMLPIMIAENAPIQEIFMLISIKVILGIIYGVLIDLFIKKEPKGNYKICKDDHCDCEHNFVKSAVIHTVKTTLFILLITFILNTILFYIGEDALKQIISKNTIFTPFLTSLIGLIPNCGASVIITELYLNKVITLASTISGLLTNSGVALLVLFKSNRNLKENLNIILLLYILGVISGILIEIINLI